MPVEDSPDYEPPWLEGVNELGEVLEGIENALDKPERFSSETLSRLAREIEEAARRHGVYEPFD